MTDTLALLSTSAEAEGSDIPAAVPVEDVTPATQGAAGRAPELMEVAVGEAAGRLEDKGTTRCQNPLWR
jgi:hypothetical protein